MAKKKAAPSWSDVKVELTDFDRAALIGLVQELYAALVWIVARIRNTGTKTPSSTHPF
jgi:hypothetical protein